MATAEQKNDQTMMKTRRQQTSKPVLRKFNSWSPDTGKDAVWRRRKRNHCAACTSRLRRSNSSSVTDEDVEELNACIELGFGFDPDTRPDLDPRLSDALPALGFYCAVHKQYNKTLSRSASSVSSAAAPPDNDSSPILVDPSEDPETVKMKLRQWARVVACSVKQLAGN
ncbi:hypothetical protein LINGRAHAP2_LOCUS12745 [Linum grandiflorum]